MRHQGLRRLFIVGSLLTCCTLARSEQPASPTEPGGAGPRAVAHLGSGSNPFLCLAISPDGRWLASGGYERTISIWDLAAGKEIRTWGGPERNLASLVFSPDGRLLASGGVADPAVHLWDAATGHQIRALPGLPYGSSSLAFAPDGRTLAAGGYRTEQVHLWDVATGKPLGQLTGRAVPNAELDGMPGPAEFSHVAFAPDGKTLVSSHLHGLIRIWDPATRRELRHFRSAVSEVFVHVGFSGDGQVLAGWGTTIRLWQPGTWKELRRFGEQPELRVACVALSPDGRMLASGSSGVNVGDETVHVWEVVTGAERCCLAGHKYAVASVAFAPDRKTLVSGSRDGTAIVWDLKRLDDPAPPLSQRDLDARWRELGEKDAARAYRALCALARDPSRTVPFLKERLRPLFLADADRVNLLVTLLDSNRFKERQEAAEELAMQIELIEPALRRALAGNQSPEAGRKLQELLGARNQSVVSPRQLQILRAIEILEDIGTAEAQKVLEELGRGTPAFQITRDAKASLERLLKRSGVH